MKKSLLGILVVGFVSLTGLSSCSTESDPGFPPLPSTMWTVLTKDTVVRADSRSAPIVESKMKVKNPTTSNQSYRVRFDSSGFAFGHTVNFCVGELCLPTSGLNPLTLDPFVLKAGAEETLKLQVLPANNSGESRLYFVLYSTTNPADSIVFDSKVIVPMF
ncbi:MAG: hypothetical protein MUC47_02035 [Candidatus Kapabacteria bacterium]|jgi:hypothetical protein|nr:hypothetical protein [Candidatus Kapabacteria bacterium]